MRGVVSWAETDASGRFHFATVFRWAEDAEHALLRDRLPGVDISLFPRRAVEAIYHRGLMAGDEYVVDLAVERIGGTSITFSWTVSTASSVCVQGQHTMVHIDDRGEPHPVPDDMRDALSGGIGISTG